MTLENEGHGQNYQSLLDRAAPILAKMTKHEAARKTCNEKLASCRAELEEMGINRKAAGQARQYSRLTENQRKGFDESYSTVRDALGEPIGAELPMM